MKDTFNTVDDGFEMKEAMQNCSLKAIPQCNHYGHIEHPELIAKLLLEFIE